MPSVVTRNLSTNSFSNPRNLCSTGHAACNRYRHYSSSAATYVPIHTGASAEFPELLCLLLALWSLILVPLGTTLCRVTWRQSFFWTLLGRQPFWIPDRTWKYSDFSWFCSTLSRQFQGTGHSIVDNLSTRFALRLIQNISHSPNRRTYAAGKQCTVHAYESMLCLVPFLLTFWRLTSTIVVVPHRQPLNVAFYIFIQQI